MINGAKARPVLFNDEMIRAILDGRKTQTRIVIRSVSCNWPTRGSCFSGVEWLFNHDNGAWVYYALDAPDILTSIQCPYKPGDLLWVREAWRIADLKYDENPGIQYRADGTEAWCDPTDYDWDEDRYESWFERMTMQLMEDCEKAGLESDHDYVYRWTTATNPNRWRRAIHLPRWASRIKLDVTAVRTERVCDISEEDAYAEGITDVAFLELWDSINAIHNSDLNPWVWVVEFQAR